MARFTPTPKTGGRLYRPNPLIKFTKRYSVPLAAYLPYGVDVSNKLNLHDFGLCKNTIEKLVGCYSENIVTDKDEFCIEYCILHLRPLSDITREIEHNGKKFVPCDELEWVTSDNLVLFVKNRWGAVDYWRIEKLFEWHFDVFGLIPADLAVVKED